MLYESCDCLLECIVVLFTVGIAGASRLCTSSVSDSKQAPQIVHAFPSVSSFFVLSLVSLPVSCVVEKMECINPDTSIYIECPIWLSPSLRLCRYPYCPRKWRFPRFSIPISTGSGVVRFRLSGVVATVGFVMISALEGIHPIPEIIVIGNFHPYLREGCSRRHCFHQGHPLTLCGLQHIPIFLVVCHTTRRRVQVGTQEMIVTKSVFSFMFLQTAQTQMGVLKCDQIEKVEVMATFLRILQPQYCPDVEVTEEGAPASRRCHKKDRHIKTSFQLRNRSIGNDFMRAFFVVSRTKAVRSTERSAQARAKAKDSVKSPSPTVKT